MLDGWLWGPLGWRTFLHREHRSSPLLAPSLVGVITLDIFEGCASGEVLVMLAYLPSSSHLQGVNVQHLLWILRPNAFQGKESVIVHSMQCIYHISNSPFL